MTSDKLIFLSGISLVIGGLLATTGWLLFARFDPGHNAYLERFWLPFNFLVIAGGFFIALGLPGFYASQARQSGVLGLVGFVVFFAGIIFAYLTVHSIQTVTMPNIPIGMRYIVSFAAPSLLVGGLLTAIAIWRAGVYPPWLAVALIVSGFLGLLSQFIPMPVWLARNIFSAMFTLTMALIGIHVINIPVLKFLTSP
jgi:hypothetical protein